MRRKNHVAKTVLSALLALAAVGGPALCATAAADAREVIKQAKAEAGSIRAQGEALTLLAWPDQGRPDPQVAAMARAELIDFGNHGLGALRSAMHRVPSLYTTDVLTTMIQARRRITENNPPEYIPTLEDVLWLGSPDARRLAIPELALYRYTPALMACVDTAIRYPGLQEVVVRNLGDFRNHRARFYLEQVLLEGPAEIRPVAADSLVRIGGPALVPLHGAALMEDPEIRIPAIRALTPAAGVDDLTTLYEYLVRFPDDDEILLQEVRTRAELLESVLEQQMDFDSASPSPLE